MSTADAPPSRSRAARLQRAWWRWRHLIAALCLGLAAVTALQALSPTEPDAVVVLNSDVAAGQVLTESEVRLEPASRGARPDTAFTAQAEVVGAAVAGGLPAGTVLSPDLLLGEHAAAHAGVDEVVIAVPVVAHGVQGLVAPGQEVNLLATDPDGGHAEVVARNVRIVSVSPGEEGMLALGGNETDVTVLHLVCSENVASLLIGRSSWAPLIVAVPGASSTSGPSP